jgi:hypothetical protein
MLRAVASLGKAIFVRTSKPISIRVSQPKKLISRSKFRKTSFNPSWYRCYGVNTEDLISLGAPDQDEKLRREITETVTNALSKQPPSEEELINFARKHMEETGKSLIPTPAFSAEPQTKEMNVKLRQFKIAQDYIAMSKTFTNGLMENTLPDAWTLTLMIEAMTEINNDEGVNQLIELQNKLNMEKTVLVYNALLQWTARRQDSTRAALFFREMSQNHLKLDIRTLDYYMQSHSKPQEFAVALEIFSKYPEKYGLTVDSDMQASFIQILLTTGREEVALKRWQAMMEGKLPAPTNHGIQIMMDHFFSKGEYDRVHVLFASIKTRFGLYPDAKNFGTLLKVRIRQGKSDEALAIVYQLCAENWAVSIDAMTELMNSFTTSKEPEKVEKLWHLLPKAKIPPSEPLLHILVTSLCSVGKPDRALAFMSMAQEKYAISMTRRLYVMLLSVYGPQRQLGKVLTLYRRMVFTDKIMPSPSSFVALVLAYAADGREDAIGDMFKHPQNFGIPKINRHFFQPVIDGLAARDPYALRTFFEFDFTRLKDVENETKQELDHINTSLSGIRESFR